MSGKPSMNGRGGHNIAQRFFSAAGSFPDKIVFYYYRGGLRSLTYREVASRVRDTASLLVRSGLSRGDRVAVISENRPEWCIAYLAILLAGGIAVPIDAQLSPEEVQNLLFDAGVGIVFHSRKTAVKLLLFDKRFREISGTVSTRVDFDSTGFGDLPRAADEGAYPRGTPEDIASIIYTSGTTGNPKGVMLSHENFCSDADAAVAARIVSHEDTVLAVLPLHHTYAFMCTFLVPLFFGATVTYPESIKATDMLAAMQATNASVLVGVPQLLGMMRNGIFAKMQAQPKPAVLLSGVLIHLSRFLWEKFRLSIGRQIFRPAHQAFGPRFRFFTSGGARLDPAIMCDLEALGFMVLEGYGLTETSPIVTFNLPEKRKPGSAGKPLPSVMLRIANPSAEGEGEIEIRGPMVMKGYYKNPSATREVLKEGWFRTGDIGMVDRDGYLFITGRSKEVIVLSSGKNIYPEDVERMYRGSKLIKELCVAGVDHKGVTSALHAIIVPDFEYAKSAGVTNLHEAIKWEINELSGSLPPYMRVKGFSLRKEPLPRTPLGKLRRFMITPMQEAEKALPEHAEIPLPADPLSRNILAAVREVAKDSRPINPSDNLELDLGLDSLSKIELVVVLERTFALKLPENFMADIHTVGELTEKIRHASSGQSAGQVKKAGWKEIISEEPPEEITLRQPELLMLAARIAHAVLKTFMKLFFRLEARGTEHIMPSGSVILTPNHTSYLDGFAVVLSLPFKRFRDLYSLGISDFFTGFLKGAFAKIAHVIPIDSSSYLNRALQTSAYVLRHGRSLCVFPEGGRSPDGSLLEFKKGVGILAVEMGVPVIPVHIRGAFQALPRSAAWPRPEKITVTFGRPLSADELDYSKKPADMDDYQYFASVLREKVRELSLSS